MGWRKLEVEKSCHMARSEIGAAALECVLGDILVHRHRLRELS